MVNVSVKKICVLVYVLLLVFVVYTDVTSYNGTCYEMNKSRDWAYRARATNDLSDMSKYLNESYNITARFHGNPCWFYPTPDTDIDLISSNLHECIVNCQKNQNLSDMAYQQAVHNLQETINEVADNINAASGWLFWSPWIIFVTTMPIWGGIILLCIAAKYDRW